MSIFKNKWFLTFFIVLVVAFLFFKGKNLYQKYVNNYKTDETGLVYKMLDGNERETPYGEDFHILVRTMCITPSGDTIANSFAADTATELPYPPHNGNILMTALRKMEEYSRMEILVESNQLKNQFRNSVGLKDYEKIMAMPDGKNAKFIIEMGRIMSPEKYEAYINKKRMYRVEMEANVIDAYCDTIKPKLALNESMHFRFRTDLATNNPRPVLGETIEYDVIVTRLNGAIHMSSIDQHKTYKTTLGQPNHLLKALQILPMYMHYGETATFVVPSYLAYDAEGNITVEPYEPLKIKIVNLRKLK